jgi:hypothetical protein
VRALRDRPYIHKLVGLRVGTKRWIASYVPKVERKAQSRVLGEAAKAFTAVTNDRRQTVIC